MRPGAADLQLEDGRSGDRGVRFPGHQRAVPAADGGAGHLVVPGLLRTGGRLRPGVSAHDGHPRRRHLRRQRPEDVDDAGPVRRLDLLPRAHRPERTEEAGRYLVPADGHEHPGHHAAPDQTRRRQLRGERGVLRRRPGARRPARRRGEPGLELRQVPARQRAHRHHPGGPHQGQTGRRQGPRQGVRTARRSAFRRPARRSGERRARTRADPDAGGVRLHGRQAQSRIVGAQAPRQPAPAAGHRAPRRGRRSRRAPLRRRRRSRVARVGPAQRADVPQLPQDVDLRRQQRGPAHDHRVDHSGIAR